MSDWIKCSDKLPEPGLKVLAFYKNRNNKSIIITAFYAEKFTIEQSGDDGYWCDYNEEEDCYYLPEGWHECIENWDEYGSVAIEENIVTEWAKLEYPK